MRDPLINRFSGWLLSFLENFSLDGNVLLWRAVPFKDDEKIWSTFLSSPESSLLDTQARAVHLPCWPIQMRKWVAFCVSVHLLALGPASTSSISSFHRAQFSVTLPVKSMGGTCLVTISNPQPFYQEDIGDANEQFQIIFALTSSSSRFLRAASNTMLYSPPACVDSATVKTKHYKVSQM